MVRKIVKDIFFLGQKSEPATKADEGIIQDLTDTLRANREACVGMAANMIGEKKCIIVVSVGMFILPMVNPIIINKSGKYETEEGCLSLTGVRKTTRYENIEVEYLDKNFAKKREKFSGWTAQIIQHEIDHCDGKVI
jgi:peptide deformylase